jgi:hypothetical protein
MPVSTKPKRKPADSQSLDCDLPDEWDNCSELTALSDLNDSFDSDSISYDSDAESILTSLSELEEEIQRPRHKPKIIDKLPIATTEELGTFVPLEQNILPTRNSGLAGFMEGQRKCFCSEDTITADISLSCRAESRCINRVMNVECPPMECGAGETCGNQRYERLNQRHGYK